MAAYITVGAKTTHGGTVISGSPHSTHNGIPIARKGDKVICKKCKKVVTIVTGDPTFIVDGQPIARAGDVTSCGSKLIAIQQSFAFSDFDVGGIEPAEQYVATYGDVDQGSDSDSDITIEKIYLKANKFVPLGISAFEATPVQGHMGGSSLNLDHSKIYFKIKVHSGSFNKLTILANHSNGQVSKNIYQEGSTIHKGNKTIIIKWDGFINDLYDSTFMTNVDSFTVFATNTKNNKREEHTKSAKLRYKKFEWADIVINKSNKLIHIRLRVRIDSFNVKGIPPSDTAKREIKAQGLEAQMLTRKNITNNELYNLAYSGIKKYWSRNHTRSAIKPDVTINGKKFQVFTKAVPSTRQALQTSITYNTNNERGRSNNFPKFKEVMYNTGCIKRSSGRWEYITSASSNQRFKETFAHELGHAIVSAYRGNYQSLIHEGSSTINQEVNNSYKYPATGELDLMKYSNKEPVDFFDRVVANETDVKGLLWISQLEIY